MKPRKLYIRNGILHCCYKGSHYAPEMGDDGEMETVFDSDHKVHIHGSGKGCDTVTIVSMGDEETWVRTDVDAGRPETRRDNRPEVLDGDLPEDDEAALEALQDRVQDKMRAAKAGQPAHKVANILDL